MGGTDCGGIWGLVLLGRVMLSKSLIQFSLEGWGCVSSLLFGLRPNYGRYNKDNGDLFQKNLCTYCCIQFPWPLSRPLSTHASAGDSWTLTGKSGSVSCGVTAPFSWVLVCTRFCLYPPSVFPQPCGNSLIESHWSPKSNSWGFPVPLPDPQVGKSAVGPRTFLTVQEFLWYNCFPVCESSAQCKDDMQIHEAFHIFELRE